MCILMYMDMHVYIWKENQEQMKAVEKPNELINKLLKVYFQKHSGEAVYTEPENYAWAYAVLGGTGT